MIHLFQCIQIQIGNRFYVINLDFKFPLDFCGIWREVNFYSNFFIWKKQSCWIDHLAICKRLVSTRYVGGQVEICHWLMQCLVLLLFMVLNNSQVQYDRSYIWIQTPWEFLERSGWSHEVYFLLSLPSTWSIFTYFYLLPFHNKIHYVVIGISFSLTNYGFLHCCCVNQQDVISHLPLLV